MVISESSYISIEFLRLYFHENVLKVFVMLLVVFPLYYFTSLNILPQFFNFRLLSYFTETLPWFLRPVKTCTSS